MTESDSFFTNYDKLSDEELIARINRNRQETDEHNQGQLDPDD